MLAHKSVTLRAARPAARRQVEVAAVQRPNLASQLAGAAVASVLLVAGGCALCEAQQWHENIRAARADGRLYEVMHESAPCGEIVHAHGCGCTLTAQTAMPVCWRHPMQAVLQYRRELCIGWWGGGSAACARNKWLKYCASLKSLNGDVVCLCLCTQHMHIAQAVTRDPSTSTMLVHSHTLHHNCSHACTRVRTHTHTHTHTHHSHSAMHMHML